MVSVLSMLIKCVRVRAPRLSCTNILSLNRHNVNQGESFEFTLENSYNGLCVRFNMQMKHTDWYFPR